MSRQLPSISRKSADDNTSSSSSSRITYIQLNQQVNELSETIIKVRSEVEKQFHNQQQELRMLLDQRFNDQQLQYQQQQSQFHQQINDLMNVIQNLKSNNGNNNSSSENNSNRNLNDNSNQIPLSPNVQPTIVQQSNSNQTSFIQLLKPPKPERFNGDSDQVDPFIQQVELTFTYYKVTEDQQTKLASAWLNGAAMRWFLFMRNRDSNFENLSWNEFKTSLSKQFKIQNLEQIARDKLYYLKQTFSVYKYNEEFNRLLMNEYTNYQ